MYKYDMKITYKVKLASGLCTNEHVIIECANVKGILAMIQNAGHEIVDIQVRNYDYDIFEMINKKWEVTHLYDSYIKKGRKKNEIH